jgi:hypothetical protein
MGELFAIFPAHISRGIQKLVEFCWRHEFAFLWRRRLVQHLYWWQLAQIAVVDRGFQNVSKPHQVQIDCSLRNSTKFSTTKDAALQTLVNKCRNRRRRDPVDSHMPEMTAPTRKRLMFSSNCPGPFPLDFHFVEISRAIARKERFMPDRRKAILAPIVSFNIQRLARRRERPHRFVVAVAQRKAPCCFFAVPDIYPKLRVIAAVPKVKPRYSPIAGIACGDKLRTMISKGGNQIDATRSIRSGRVSPLRPFPLHFVSLRNHALAQSLAQMINRSNENFVTRSYSKMPGWRNWKTLQT